jgi:hypothetical protein
MDTSKASKKELIEISFRPAKGGLISETRHKSRGNGFMSDSETAVHPNIGHAMKHMKESVGAEPLKKKEPGAKKAKSASMRKG